MAGPCRAGLAKRVLSLWGRAWPSGSSACGVGGVGNDGSKGCQRARGGKVQEGDTVERGHCGRPGLLAS